MKINKKIEGVLNRQINAELYSAYLYLSMAAYFESINLKGFANWMENQAKEELSHAMKFYKFVNERNGRVILAAIDKPDIEWKSPLAAFTAAYEHEVMVTGSIDQLVEDARAEKDNATESMLKWFVEEQVEEEASSSGIVEKLKMVKDSSNGLLMIDKELGKRGK
jgi:ferritin